MPYYPILFAGAFFAGETFILPGIYFVLHGTISFSGFFATVMAATLLSDSAWYALGRYFSPRRLSKWPLIRDQRNRLDKITAAFHKNGLIILVISKFIYGTRILTQIASGSAKIPFQIFISVDAIASAAWLSLITFSGYAAGKALAWSDFPLAEEAAAVASVLIILIIYRWISRIILKQKFR